MQAFTAFCVAFSKALPCLSVVCSKLFKNLCNVVNASVNEPLVCLTKKLMLFVQLSSLFFFFNIVQFNGSRNFNFSWMMAIFFNAWRLKQTISKSFFFILSFNFKAI